MRIYEAADYQSMSRRAANIISAHVILKPNCVLGLATGSTPIGAYKQLIEWYKKGDLSFAETKSHSLGASMGGLHHIAGEVIVAHDRAAHRGHAHGLAFHTQLLQGLGHQAVDDAVGAAGTVVQGRVSEGRRFLKYNSHSRFPFQSFGAQSSNIFSLYSSASICSSTSAGVGIMPPVRP